MRKFLVSAALATLVTAGAGLGVSQAAKPADAGPGPNGHNNHGLCTAYFNGQKKGQSDGAPPFVALAQDADNKDNGGDGNGTASVQEILNYCGGADAIGGNPANGRYPGCFDGDDNTPCG